MIPIIEAGTSIIGLLDETMNTTPKDWRRISIVSKVTDGSVSSITPTSFANLFSILPVIKNQFVIQSFLLVSVFYKDQMGYAHNVNSNANKHNQYIGIEIWCPRGK